MEYTTEQTHPLPADALLNVTRSVRGLTEGGTSTHEGVALAECKKLRLFDTSSGTVRVTVELAGEHPHAVFERGGKWFYEVVARHKY